MGEVRFWVLIVGLILWSILHAWFVRSVWKGVLRPRCSEGRHLWVYSEGPPEEYRCGRCGATETW